MCNLLLVLPLKVVLSPDGTPQIEAQAHNGLRLWLKHFAEVTVICTIVKSQSETSLPITSIEGYDRLSFIGLPAAWLPHKFAARLPKAVPILRAAIDQADYLHFALGGLWGDWPSIASIIAIRSKRQFSVWTDHVESEICFTTAKTKVGLPRLYWQLTGHLLRLYERCIISHADLGLFHGADCFEAYAKFSKEPHLVHNIHITRSQHISSQKLKERLSNRDRKLRIAYAGRASHEKGTMDWVKAISAASNNEVSITATWFGEGPDLAAAQDLAFRLNAPISFTGALPHARLLDELKTFDIFVFCHKTLESPRCLIEALACGLPIIGYRSPYPKDLLSTHDGGVLVDANDIDALASAIAKAADQRILERLSFEAALAALAFTDEAVFAHRSNLLKHTLSSQREQRDTAGV